MSETLIAGQTDTAPDVQQVATDAGTAPVVDGQTQQAGDAAPAADSATTETQADKPAGAPESYADFTVPDGYVLGEVGDQFKATAKELNLTQEQAQKLIDIDVARNTANKDAMSQAVTQWANETKADKELGGEHLNENVALAKKALDTFGSPALKQLLAQSGLGNHPEIIRAFYKAGKAISEDKLVTGAIAPSKRSADQILYPNQ